MGGSPNRPEQKQHTAERKCRQPSASDAPTACGCTSVKTDSVTIARHSVSQMVMVGPTVLCKMKNKCTGVFSPAEYSMLAYILSVYVVTLGLHCAPNPSVHSKHTFACCRRSMGKSCELSCELSFEKDPVVVPQIQAIHTTAHINLPGICCVCKFEPI